MLQNEYLVAKIGVDAAENGPRKECCVVAVLSFSKEETHFSEVLRLQQALLEKDAALRETQDELGSALRISERSRHAVKARFGCKNRC